MRVPLSWLRDFVDITIPIEELAHRLTMAGLEVEEIHFVGLPLPNGAMNSDSDGQSKHEIKITGLEWDPVKIVVGEIREVMPHPNADRLVLARLYDGEREHTVLTGAPNLFEYKGQGLLEKPLKVAYAREGAMIYDGHQPGHVLTSLKRAKIRGVESYSMACSEKELGISDEHEGIIILDESAPAGMPLVEYMGDAVLDIAITPNIARDANILGVAREVAALTGAKLRKPSLGTPMQGPPIEGKVSIEIQEPVLNPRFVLGLIQDIEIGPSPYEVQRRLRVAGMRPINNVVDATNYAMLEIGEPLHAFDYDILVGRAGGKPPTIITRTARPGETLVTLDDVERRLDDFTVLVCDTAGPLSIAGVIGGEESEVSQYTRNVLLEGAAWNFINIRRTLAAQNISSEAAYRFSRGVHPAMSERGVRKGLELMRQWTGGVVDKGLVDNYPLPPENPTVEISPEDVRRWLGIELSLDTVAEILRRLDFRVEVDRDTLRATTPDHRLDIGEGVVGVADLMEEIARIYGYDRIPETRMADALPPQRRNRSLELEERIRDLLVGLGLQEVITYRVTSPENEARRLPDDRNDSQKRTEPVSDGRPYLRLANYMSSDRVALRHSLIASLLEIVEHNARLSERHALFEIGPVFFASEEGMLPDEPTHLAIVLTGSRSLPGWQSTDTSPMDIFDLKGIVENLLDALHLENYRFQPCSHPSFHPGKCAQLSLDGKWLGVLGELHPLVKEHYELPETAIMASELDLDALLPLVPDRYDIRPVPAYPPVLEDLAVTVDESLPAGLIEEAIWESGGEMLVSVNLFDEYRGEQTGPGKKSLAYNLAYQAPDRTLTDEEVAKIRGRIIRKLETDFGAKLRS
jgi:phenylalanyl-tRNA synthetase beta chain